MLNRGAYLLLCFSLILQTKAAFAKIHMPKFENEAEPVSHELPRESVHEFRVLIFPHLGTYATPQGRESVTSSVKVISTSGCKRYRAKLDLSNSEWKKDGELISEEKEIYLSITHPGPFYFECTNGFQVKRSTKLKNYSYIGNFVSKSNGKSVQIINLISPEEYLRGVVPAEVGSSWPIEALKAQAVAARTYAWWSVLQYRTEERARAYDIDDTVQYQAYIGTGAETESTNKAIDDTKGLVLRYNGEIIKSYFSADSGGYTESSVDPFDEALPYCQSKQEHYLIDSFPTDWSTTLSLNQISIMLRARGLISKGSTVSAVDVKDTDRNESGRAKNITVTTVTGKKYSVDGAKFRLALKLKSTMFNTSTATIKTSKGTVYSIKFSGKGHGHGVGMGQKGALTYVQNLGWGFEQVLKFYYTGVTLSE